MDLTRIGNSAPLYDPAQVNEAYASYIGQHSLGNTINLANIGDADIRRLLLHEIYQKNTQYQFWHKNSLLEMLKMLGAVRSTSQAYKIGYKSRTKLSMTLTATGNSGASGVPVLWTLPAAYSVTQGSIVDIDDVIEIGETRLQVQVIGIDTGNTTLDKMGRNASGVAVTPTSMGGAAGAHVLAVIPIGLEAVPAVTSADKLFVVTKARPEGSCPTNSGNGKQDDIFEFGWSTVDHTRKVTGTANSTAMSGCEITVGGKTVKVLADQYMLEDWLTFQYKLTGQIFLGQRVTNTNAIMEDAFEKQNNGVLTQIRVNGGAYRTYVRGSYDFDADVVNIVDFLNANGIKEAFYWMGYEQYKEFQRNVAPQYWKANVIINADNYDGGMKFNWDTKAVEIFGVTLYPMLLPLFNDDGTWKTGYAYTGIVIPKQTTQVVDALTGEKFDAHGIDVFFKKDKYGRTRDENYMIQPQGGAAEHQNGVCDTELTRNLAQVCTMLSGANNCMIKQGIAA